MSAWKSVHQHQLHRGHPDEQSNNWARTKPVCLYTSQEPKRKANMTLIVALYFVSAFIPTTRPGGEGGLQGYPMAVVLVNLCRIGKQGTALPEQGSSRKTSISCSLGQHDGQDGVDFREVP
jgi:hypothetical protein